MISQTGVPPPGPAAAEHPAEETDAHQQRRDHGEEARHVMMATSRLPMWDSSWASTPSTSGLLSLYQSPSVTATTEFFGLRPVANAFGTSVGTTAIRGGQVGHRAKALDHVMELRRLIALDHLRA